MIPIVKGWSTEIAQEVDVARRAGARRHGLHRGNRRRAALRDARITTIYEGTTGIQANDLIGRKTARDGGAVARAVAAEIDKVAAKLAARTRTRAAGHRRAARGRDRGPADRRSTGWCPRTASSRAPRTRARSRTSSCGASRPAGGRWDARRSSASEQLAAGEGDSALPAREDRHRALLRRLPAAAGVGARAHDHRTAATARWRWTRRPSDGGRGARRRARLRAGRDRRICTRVRFAARVRTCERLPHVAIARCAARAWRDGTL